MTAPKGYTQIFTDLSVDACMSGFRDGVEAAFARRVQFPKPGFAARKRQTIEWIEAPANVRVGRLLTRDSAIAASDAFEVRRGADDFPRGLAAFAFDDGTRRTIELHLIVTQPAAGLSIGGGDIKKRYLPEIFAEFERRDQAVTISGWH